MYLFKKGLTKIGSVMAKAYFYNLHMILISLSDVTTMFPKLKPRDFMPFQV